MRTLWLFIAAIVLAGIIVFALSRPPSEPVGLTQMAPNLDQQAGDLARELAASADARTEEEPLPEKEVIEPAPEETVAEAEPEPETENAPAAEETGDTNVTAGLNTEIANATVVPGTIKRISKDELSADNEFILRGEGTEDSPFEPTWEYLFSAADTYQPRLGENEIPQRIALLDGKWVRVAGFTAFPLVTGESSEMLVMLNKWDGCCIGVPPTPFDAIEVRLNAPVARGPKHQISFGTVTGRMKVDPYLIEDWLVGLYILEDSTLVSDL